MKSFRKTLAMLLATSLVICMFGGCSGGGDASEASGAESTAAPAESSKDAATPAPASGDKAVVEFWHSMSGKNGELIDQMAVAFNEAHDDIEVVATFQGSYWEAAAKAQTAVSAGENPDILMMGADHVGIFASEENLLADLTPYLAQSGIDKEDFVEALTWDYFVDDKLVALPFGRSTPILYVNTDMIQEAGLSIPTTWEEMETVSNALVQKEGDEITRFGFGMPYDTWYWFMIVAQAGGRFFNEEQTGLGCVEDGTMLAGFSYLQNLHNSGAMYFGPTVDSGATTRQMFLNQQAAMLMTSVGDYGTIKENADFNFEIAWMPKGKEQVVPTGGNSVVMMEAASDKDAAWEFMRWVIQEPEGGLFFVMNTGYIPYTYSMTESEQIKELWANDPNYETAFKQLELASDRGHRSPKGGTVMNELYVAIQAIMYDNEDVQQQIDILADSVADIMAG